VYVLSLELRRRRPYNQPLTGPHTLHDNNKLRTFELSNSVKDLTTPSRGPNTLPSYLAQAPEERPKLERSLPYTRRVFTGTWECLAFICITINKSHDFASST